MEGAQDAQAVLSFEAPRIKLRLFQADTAKAQRMRYWSLFILLLGYPVTWLLGRSYSVAAFSGAFMCWVLVFFYLKRGWPDRFILAESDLLCFGDALILANSEQKETFPLNALTSLEITYRGFKGERLTNRIQASGIDNFIQINGGETYRFEMLSEQEQESFREELRRWYLLKVKLKEHRQDGPTFLLHRGLSYGQIQAYTQEFGVNLYG